MSKRFFYVTLWLVSSYLASACAMTPASLSQSPIPEPQWQGPLPDIAAEFHTETPAETTQWRIWRKSHEVIRENLATDTADYWYQDGNTLIQKTYYHHDRRGMEFQQTDLQMLNKQPQWQALALVFDPALLSHLKLTDSGWRDGVPFQRYQGKLQDSEWVIEVRTDLMLPLRIEHKSQHAHETITLVEAYPLAQAPWQPVPTRDYNVIDFADIGDMESDPFVKKIEAQLGGVHHH